MGERENAMMVKWRKINGKCRFAFLGALMENEVLMVVFEMEQKCAFYAFSPSSGRFASEKERRRET
jgi:uncharacterized DUF497 family protein